MPDLEGKIGVGPLACSMHPELVAFMYMSSAHKPDSSPTAQHSRGDGRGHVVEDSKLGSRSRREGPKYVLEH